MATIVTKNYPILRTKYLQKDQARRISFQYNTALKTRELNIYWPLEDGKLIEEGVRMLDTFGDSGSQTAKRYVMDPMASGTPHPGVWRVVYVRGNHGEEPSGIYMLLREGWATTLTDDEARIQLVAGTPQTGDLSLTRYWPNIANSHVETLTTTLNATRTVTSFVQEGVTRTGTYAVSAVRGEKDEADGAGRVYQTLTQYTALSGATDEAINAELDALRSTVTYDNEILNLFGLQTGEGDALAMVWRNLDVSSRDKACVTLTDAQALALGAGIPTGFTWTYAGRKWQEEQNGTATFIVALKKTVWSNTTPTYYNVDVANYLGIDARQEFEAPGLQTGTGANQGSTFFLLLSSNAAAFSGTTIAVGTVGKHTDNYVYYCHTACTSGFDAAKFDLVVDARLRMGDNGESIITYRVKKVFAYLSGANVTAPPNVKYLAAFGNQELGVQYEWPHITPSRVSDMFGTTADTKCGGYTGSVAGVDVTSTTLISLEKVDEGDGSATIRAVRRVSATSEAWTEGSVSVNVVASPDPDDVNHTITTKLFLSSSGVSTFFSSATCLRGSFARHAGKGRWLCQKVVEI